TNGKLSLAKMPDDTTADKTCASENRYNPHGHNLPILLASSQLRLLVSGGFAVGIIMTASVLGGCGSLNEGRIRALCPAPTMMPSYSMAALPCLVVVGRSRRRLATMSCFPGCGNLRTIAK